MRRPLQKMLHPKSVHEYGIFAEKYGFTKFDKNYLSFDPNEFYKEWNELTNQAINRGSYNKVRTAYPELLRTEGTERIIITEGEDAVYTSVSILKHLLNAAWAGIVDTAPYSPAWGVMSKVFLSSETGMISFTTKDVVGFLEWAQYEFGLFEYLEHKGKNLHIMLPDDVDSAGESCSRLSKNKDGEIVSLGIFLTKSNGESIYPGVLYEHTFFHELSHILYGLHYNASSEERGLTDDVVRMMSDEEILGRRFLPYSEEERHECVIDFITEGMLAGTEMEKYFCPHKDKPEFIKTAKEYFRTIIGL